MQSKNSHSNIWGAIRSSGLDRRNVCDFRPVPPVVPLKADSLNGWDTSNLGSLHTHFHAPPRSDLPRASMPRPGDCDSGAQERQSLLSRAGSHEGGPGGAALGSGRGDVGAAEQHVQGAPRSSEPAGEQPGAPPHGKRGSSPLRHAPSLDAPVCRICLVRIARERGARRKQRSPCGASHPARPSPINSTPFAPPPPHLRPLQEEDDPSLLQTPCSCAGTQKWAHTGCLQRWINEKGSMVRWPPVGGAGAWGVGGRWAGDAE